MFDSTLMGQFVLYDKEDYDSNSDSLDNINVRVSEDFEGPFTEKDMNTLINQLNLMGASTGFKIISNELKTFEGEPVIYYEAETNLTDEMLDMLVEDGSVTEADLEAMGEESISSVCRLPNRLASTPSSTAKLSPLQVHIKIHLTNCWKR